MKASELRIGNWINIIGLVPTQVTPKHIEFIADGDDQYEPIPLTEEWLVKLGLINSNGLFKWHRSAIYKGNEKWIYGILGDDNSSYYHVSELQYVHQLQNLYFALTGEELTIKE